MKSNLSDLISNSGDWSGRTSETNLLSQKYSQASVQKNGCLEFGLM